jgi:hypothetical protein
MYGSNINLDTEGNITSVVDGPLTLEFYLAMCEANGLGKPPVMIG